MDQPNVVSHQREPWNKGLGDGRANGSVVIPPGGGRLVRVVAYGQKRNVPATPNIGGHSPMG